MQKNNPKKLHNILFLGQFPPPVHGVSVMNTNILNSELIRKEFDIETLDLKFGKTIQDLEKFSLKKLSKAITYSFEILFRMIKKKRSIVYFTFTPTGIGFYRDAFYVFLLKLFRAKIVLHLHGKGIKKTAGSSLKTKLYTLTFNNTYLICLSQILIDDIRDVYKGSPFVVPNGISIHNKSTVPATNQHNGETQILFLSNLIRNKGVIVLVEALSILHQKGLKFHVRFVGSPSNITVEMLEDILKEKGIAHMATVTGAIYGDDKFKEYEKADIFVFPTYNDAFGLVNLEAMQYSLPVISTYEGCIPDIVSNNETGFLVNREDPLMLSEKINELLQDEALRTRMGKKGYQKFMSNYTLQHFETNMYNTFKTVLSQ